MCSLSCLASITQHFVDPKVFKDEIVDLLVKLCHPAVHSNLVEDWQSACGITISLECSRGDPEIFSVAKPISGLGKLPPFNGRCQLRQHGFFYKEIHPTKLSVLQRD